MPDYLITRHFCYRVVNSQYANFIKFAQLEPMEADFHVSLQTLRVTAERPDFLPGDAAQVYALSDNRQTMEKEFEDFYRDWKYNNAYVYRGIPGCHFSWPELRGNANLASEGNNDYPTFTMGNAQPTRWIPTDLNDGQCVGIAMQNTDNQTSALTGANNVPLGIVVKVNVGRTLPAGVQVAFLNPGETVVRGPLAHPAFQIHKVIWLGPAGIVQSVAPNNMPPNRLMPQRPYQPAPGQINIWWADMTANWLPNVTLAGTTLTLH